MIIKVNKLINCGRIEIFDKDDILLSKCDDVLTKIYRIDVREHMRYEYDRLEIDGNYVKERREYLIKNMMITYNNLYKIDWDLEKFEDIGNFMKVGENFYCYDIIKVEDSGWPKENIFGYKEWMVKGLLE